VNSAAKPAVIGIRRTMRHFVDETGTAPSMAAIIALIESLAVMAYVALVVIAVVRGCRFRDQATAVSIVSGHPVAEAVARLASRCGSAGAWTTGSEGMTGSVTAGSVRLARRVKGKRNSFQPVFSGDFRPRGEQVVLVGEFGMAASMQGFLMFWGGGVGVALLEGLHGAIVRQRGQGWVIVAATAALLAVCVASVRAAKKLSAGDIPWMTAVLRDALA
jgi:hypothetical protein